jgi:TfoX/Sxy family transcriptional regulator of competence genes
VAYDEGLAERLRELLAERPDIAERKMFGGLAFLCRGHMFVGISGDVLMVRVGPAAHAASLARPHARPMDFTGRPMKGYVFVDAEGFEEDDDLAAWSGAGLDFVATLPAKS